MSCKSQLYGYVKFEVNGIRHHCIRKTIVNGDSLPVYLIIQIIFPDVFLINIANKVIYLTLTFDTAAGWYNFLRKYYRYYIISI